MSRSFILAIGCDALFDAIDAGARPGLCFDLVRRTATWNHVHGADVIITIVSRRRPEEGGPLLSMLHDIGINATGFFTNGEDVLPYVIGIGCDIFMSTEMDDVQAAVDAGIPSARMQGRISTQPGDLIRVAFDGDAVLLHHEGEKIYAEHKLAGFLDHERRNVTVPMEPGPLLAFLLSMNRLEAALDRKLFRIALVTARSGAACERAMRTIEHHGARVDQALFCGDIPKLEVLRAFQAHLFFDDSDRHLLPASDHLTTGKVPWRRTPLV